MLKRFVRWLLGIPNPDRLEARRQLDGERDRHLTGAMTEADRSNLAGGMRGGPGGEQYRG
jgi:hypothetical protein